MAGEKDSGFAGGLAGPCMDVLHAWPSALESLKGSVKHVPLFLFIGVVPQLKHVRTAGSA